jgi:RNA polymerase sigma factor (sigma-70 family)
VPAVDPILMRRLYTEHSAALFVYLSRRVGRDLAEDLLAETFRVAMESYPTFDGRRGSEKMWLFGVATNLLRHHWRTEQRRLLALTRTHGQELSYLDPLIAQLEGTAARVDAEHEAGLVLRAVASLQPEDRDLLILSGWERLNSTEIGRVLGVRPSTVRSRLRRLRSDLQEAIRPTAGAAQPSPTGATP